MPHPFDPAPPLLEARCPGAHDPCFAVQGNISLAFVVDALDDSLELVDDCLAFHAKLSEAFCSFFVLSQKFFQIRSKPINMLKIGKIKASEKPLSTL